MESPAGVESFSFHYRFVDYGTSFHKAEGLREDAGGDPTALHSNELATDVGAVCIGYHGEDRTVVDHHFFRERGQFPSASAAVLHNAKALRKRFANHSGNFWLVTHRLPDFDAYCSLYLARWLLVEPQVADDYVQKWENAGVKLLEGGWFGGRDEIDWFKPDVSSLPSEIRWPILLAAYAACVDNSKRITCPRDRTLHSILYAAEVRCRDLQSDGAISFFNAVRTALTGAERDTPARNPLFDSVLEGNKEFEPELRLLDREAASYERDIRRAARTVVYVKRLDSEAFATWYDRVKNLPLFADTTVDGPPTKYEQADGIFIRDPESLLFKEWVRNDTDNSSMGRGFLFTAVAYSDGRREAVGENTTDYYFALDPERAGRLHLQNVWAKLQREEVLVLAGKFTPEQLLEKRKSWAKQGKDNTLEVRSGFEGYAKGHYEKYFFDPWYDAPNYGCMIVPTPNWGTLMVSGSAPDLSDDPVAWIVRNELESALYTSDVSVSDFSAARGKKPSKDRICPMSSPPEFEGNGHKTYRFCRINLDGDVRLLEGTISTQIGQRLWGFLHPEERDSLPSDFCTQHLIKSSDWVGVWSHRGVAVAYKASAEGKVDGSRKLFGQLIDLAAGLEELTAAMEVAAKESPSHPDSPAKHGDSAGPYAMPLRRGEELMMQSGHAQHALSLPDNRVVSHFFQSSRLQLVLTTLRDVYVSAVDREQARATTENVREMAELQSKLEWLEVFIVAVYAVELSSHVGHSFHFSGDYVGWWLISIAVIVTSLLIWLLKPFQHKGLDWRRVAPVVGAMTLLFAVYVWWGIARAHQTSTNSAQHNGEPSQTREHKEDDVDHRGMDKGSEKWGEQRQNDKKGGDR